MTKICSAKQCKIEAVASLLALLVIADKITIRMVNKVYMAMFVLQRFPVVVIGCLVYKASLAAGVYTIFFHYLKS